MWSEGVQRYPVQLHEKVIRVVDLRHLVEVVPNFDNRLVEILAIFDCIRRTNRLHGSRHRTRVGRRVWDVRRRARRQRRMRLRHRRPRRRIARLVDCQHGVPRRKPQRVFKLLVAHQAGTFAVDPEVPVTPTNFIDVRGQNRGVVASGRGYAAIQGVS